MSDPSAVAPATSSPSVIEGTVPYVVNGETFQTWYKLVGTISPDAPPPAILLHGGPGFTHDYLSVLAELAQTQIDDPNPSAKPQPVLFYDQIGNGHSSRLTTKPLEFFTVKLFVDELANLITHLNIQEYHLLGHSWGGQLAAEFAVALVESEKNGTKFAPPGLRSLILSNTLTDGKLRDESWDQLYRKLPDYEGFVRARDNVDKDPEAYKRALRGFHERWAIKYVRQGVREHKRRQRELAGIPVDAADEEEDEFPRDLEVLDKIFGNKATGEVGDPTVLTMMSLEAIKDWSITERLSLISVPTLLITGKEDMLQEFTCEDFFWEMPNTKVKWVDFARSSHVPMWEERDRYRKVVLDWVGRVNARVTRTNGNA